MDKDLSVIGESPAETNPQDEESKKPSSWKDHYIRWKTGLYGESGALRSRQQKVSEVRQIGTSAILVCLQHSEITDATLHKIVETNFLNSCYRLAGLRLLEFAMGLI